VPESGDSRRDALAVVDVAWGDLWKVNGGCSHRRGISGEASA
jgi:hypothetical protein